MLFAIFSNTKCLENCKNSCFVQKIWFPGICSNGCLRGFKYVKPKNWIIEWKIRPGDPVMVISGKNKGKEGNVLEIDKMKNGVAVKGIKERIVRNHEGKKIRVCGFIHISNVMMMDPVLRVPTRVALRHDDSGPAVRVARKSGLIIPFPNPSKICSPGRKSVECVKGGENDESLTNTQLQLNAIDNEEGEIYGVKDTSKDKALEKTFNYQRDVETMDAIRQMLSKYNRELR